MGITSKTGKALSRMDTKEHESDAAPAAKPLNRSLHLAKAAYLDAFRNKIVYCNCDDPFESNFFKYFAANFNKLRLKRLICTSYEGGYWGSPLAGQMTLLFDEYNAVSGHRKKPKAIAVIVDHVKDENNDVP